MGLFGRFALVGAVLLAIPAGAIGLLLLATPPAPEAPPLPGRLSAGQTWFEGRERTWLAYEPSRLRTPAPLVLLLPGSGQDAEALRAFTTYRFDELAERDGVLLVYAEAWAEGSAFGPEWNECRKNTQQPAHLENVNDVGYVLWLLDALAKRYPIDPSRVFAAGVSDGGQMAYRLATEHPERFDAVAIVVAQQAAPDNSNCRAPRGPISVLVMNGTEDPIIPYEGGIASFHGLGSAGEVQSMAGTLAHWKAVNGIVEPGTRETLPDRDPTDGSTVLRERWVGPGGERLEAYHVIGGGHSLPGGYRGAPEFLLGPVNRDLHGADAIWAFFFPDD